MSDHPIEQIKAGNAFRDTMIARADAWSGHAPLWHGWAIMDAFLAGIDYARPLILEEAAKVAMDHPSGSYEVAIAIRALKEQPPESSAA